MKKAEPGRSVIASPTENPIEIILLENAADLVGCIALQRAVWNTADLEVVPVSQLRAAQHAGGLVAGAYIAGEIVGFCYGFPSFRPELHADPGLHSHMTGVAASARGRGVGRSLKEFQRKWCLEKGFNWIEWTFDPLRAGNARFNLRHLGAVASEYLVDTYGRMEDGLNEGLPSDRLMAYWDLEISGKAEPEVTGEERGRRTTSSRRPEPALKAEPDGRPGQVVLDARAPAVSIDLPLDLDRLLADRPEVALEWRFATRLAFLHYLAEGYLATDFAGGTYILTHPERI